MEEDLIRQYYGTAFQKYKVNLADSASVPEIHHFRDAAHNLFCHSCGQYPVLEDLLTELATAVHCLTIAVGRDSLRETVKNKRLPRPATIALSPMRAADDSVRALFELAQSTELSKAGKALLVEYEHLNERARELTDKERKARQQIKD